MPKLYIYLVQNSTQLYGDSCARTTLGWGAVAAPVRVPVKALSSPLPLSTQARQRRAWMVSRGKWGGRAKVWVEEKKLLLVVDKFISWCNKVEKKHIFSWKETYLSLPSQVDQTSRCKGKPKSNWKAQEWRGSLALVSLISNRTGINLSVCKFYWVGGFSSQKSVRLTLKDGKKGFYKVYLSAKKLNLQG